MIAYRLADARHPIFDPTGALLHGGRWNSPGSRIIYAAETYAGALLEILVHANLGAIPRNQRAVRIDIPEQVSLETVLPEQVEQWDAEDMTASRAFGDAWIASRRTAVLRVPSVVTAGRECNVVIHADHPDFRWIRPGEPEPVIWDRRLFRRSSAR
ncbi:RES domain-containing protein [Acidobacteria bacterium AB60]|nr:RES domain-containing protein [Acidobacteria bacterium AB60]